MIPAATLVALCAIGSAMTWAVTSLLVRALVPRFGSVAVNALRSTLSGGLLLAWVAATGGRTTPLATVARRARRRAGEVVALGAAVAVAGIVVLNL